MAKYSQCPECDQSFVGDRVPAHTFNRVHCPGGPATPEPEPPTPTRVIFRTYTGKDGGDVIAILLDCDANPGHVVCYQHVGQHGEGKYWHIMSATRPATEEERAPLFRELTQRGYQLHIRQRRSIQGTRHQDSYRAQETRK